MGKKDEEQKTLTMSGALAPGVIPPTEKKPLPQLQSQPGSAPSSAPTMGGVKPVAKQQKAGTGTFANLKSYIQAAQGGGQQKVAQAATQKVQNVGMGAQKATQQAQKTFGQKMTAGSGSVYQGDQGQDLTQQEAASRAQQRVQEAIDAARGIVYQAPQPVPAAPEQQATQTPPTQASAPTPQAELTPDQMSRFSDVVNAQYAGPGSIQEAGLYEQAASKARVAQEAAKQSATAAGREQLLRNIFSQGRDYSRGQSKLDALLLNTSQQGVGELQKQAETAGKAQQQLQQAQTESANLATGRAKEISDIQQQARKSFLEGRTAEETGTEKSIDALIKDPALDASGNPIPKLNSEGKPILDANGQPVYQTKWDQLPEYYRDVIRNKETTNKAIQAEKLAALKTSTGLDEAGYNTALQNVKAQEKAVQDASMENLSRSMAGLSQDPEADARVEAAKARLESSKKALAGYSDFATQLKDIKNMNMSQLNLTPEEAAVLGISSGEGLYNLGQGLIQDVNAERGRLITKDQFARQQALARLAGTDISKALQKDLMYTDAEKAGTQTLASSLNTEAIRNALNEQEKKFREEASTKTITGTGSKKNKTSGKRYYASEDANVKDVLSRAGYDFNAPVNQKVGNLNIYGSRSQDQDPDTLGNIAEEAVTPRLTPDEVAGVYANDSTLARKAGYAAADYGSMGITAGLRALGLDLTGGVMSGIDNIAGTSIFGGGTSSKESKSDAARFAREDLQRRYADYLKEKGFGNRANIENTQATAARSAALQELLRRQG